MDKLNIFDYLIIILISSLAFGVYGGALQPVRVIAICMMPYTLSRLLRKDILAQFKGIIYLLGAWYIFAIVSLLWSINRGEGVAEIFYYTVNFSLLLTIATLAADAKRPIHSILIAWCIFILATIPIALNEIINDQHLSVSKLAAGSSRNYGDGAIMNLKFASTTFGNYNGYVTAISMALPFILSYYPLCKKILQKILFWALYISIIYILLTNASRGGVLVLAVTSAIFIYRNYKARYISNFTLIALIIGAAILSITHFESVAFQLLARLNNVSIVDASSRSDIYLCALKTIQHYAGMGCGLGGLNDAMAIFTTGITATHNLWLEILVQHGVFIFIPFAIALFFMLRNLIRSHNFNKATLGYMVIASILPMSVINSFYLLTPSLWLYLASMYTISKIDIDNGR